MSSLELDQRVAMLEREGADPLRLELLALARRFKRSWIEMAEALVRLRDSRAYEAWGYPDIYSYCADELCIKKRTVDKLTVSYAAVERHAPTMLTGDERLVPSYEAVDYFARAVDARSDEAGGPFRAEGNPRAPEQPDVLDELRQAVFEEGAPISALRRRFHSVLYAKSREEEEREALERASACARRLASMLPGLELSAERHEQVAAALEALLRDLDELLAEADHREQRAS